MFGSRSFADHCWLMVPGCIGVILTLFGALPSLVSGYDLFPHMGVILCCFWVIHYPQAWPHWFVFFLGMLHDVLSGTALGSQALLLMALCVVLRRHARSVNRQNFRMLLIEVAVMSALYMAMLWLVMSWVTHDWLPIWPVVKELFFTVLFYPLIHLLLIPILRLLPPLR